MPDSSVGVAAGAGAGAGVTVLGPARHKGLHEEVLDMLRTAITSGELRPGQRILEVELAAQLQVSRATLREALRRLEEDGLVVTQAHRGTYVNRLTAADVRQLFELRRLIEGHAVRTVAATIGDEQIAALQAIVDQFEAAQHGPVEQRIEQDMRFHEAICALAGNRYMTSVWCNIRSHLRAILATSRRARLEPVLIASEHQAVVDALRRRDGEEAAARLCAHLINSERVEAELADALPPADPGHGGHPSGERR